MLLRHSVGRHVDRLWIGVWAPDASEFVLRRVEEALGLIKIYDRVRYDRLIRDLERVWVTPISGSSACFDHSIGACELDPRFVLAETSLPEKIAGVSYTKQLMRGSTGAALAMRKIYALGWRRSVSAVNSLLQQGSPMGSPCARKQGEFWNSARMRVFGLTRRSVSGTALAIARYCSILGCLTGSCELS
jgi:hypothetical protein